MPLQRQPTISVAMLNEPSSDILKDAMMESNIDLVLKLVVDNMRARHKYLFYRLQAVEQRLAAIELRLGEDNIEFLKEEDDALKRLLGRETISDMAAIKSRNQAEKEHSDS
jgi:hypothetical protein